MTLPELLTLTPDFDWNRYLQAIGAPSSDFNINVPDFMVNMSTMIQESSLSELKDYLRWHFILVVGPQVSPKFEKEFFHFWNMQLNGAKEMKPRWKICTQKVEKVLSYALAEAYTSTLDTQTIRSKVDEMIKFIKQVFRDVLE
jgi:predicted metalloendopeptidase